MTIVAVMFFDCVVPAVEVKIDSQDILAGDWGTRKTFYLRK